MANPDTPFGLRPVCHRNGAPYNGACRPYYVKSDYGTALFVGDPVITITASADANGIQEVQRATAGSGAYISGVIVGMATSAGDPAVPLTADKPVYSPASTEGYVLVADDPDLLFEIQEDGVGGAIGAGAAGRNADIIIAAGSTVTGYSGVELDSNTLDTTNTLQLRVVAPVKRADNDPTLTNAKWLVSINLHSARNLTGI